MKIEARNDLYIFIKTVLQKLSYSVLTMNKDSFINQDLPHPDCLASRLEAIILFHQPINKFFTRTTLPVR